jgi:ankyrin repeat protein
MSSLEVNTSLSLNSQDNWGWSLLHHAVHKSQLNLIKELLLAGVDVNSVDRSNFTPLHVAAFYGNSEAAELLLLFSSTSSSPPLSSSFSSRPFSLSSSSSSSSLPPISSLLNPNIREFENGWTPLHVAVARDYENVARLIIRYCLQPSPSSPFSSSSSFSSSLSSSSSSSSSFSSSINNLNLNALDFGNRTCLQLAVERRTNPHLAVFLISKGARMGLSYLSIPPPLEEGGGEGEGESKEVQKEQEEEGREAYRKKRRKEGGEEQEEEDVTFIVEGKEVKSSSSLLANRCDYFSILFGSGACWKETLEKRVLIPSTSLKA